MSKIISKKVWVPGNYSPKVAESDMPNAPAGGMDLIHDEDGMPWHTFRTKKDCLKVHEAAKRMTITLEVHDG